MSKNYCSSLYNLNSKSISNAIMIIMKLQICTYYPNTSGPKFGFKIDLMFFGLHPFHISFSKPSTNKLKLCLCISSLYVFQSPTPTSGQPQCHNLPPPQSQSADCPLANAKGNFFPMRASSIFVAICRFIFQLETTTTSVLHPQTTIVTFILSSNPKLQPVVGWC